jgi:hypothetical protein
VFASLLLSVALLLQVLAVMETGRAFQEALCQQQQTAAAVAAAQSQPGHSSSSSSNNTAVLGQADFTNYVAVVEAFEAVGDLRRQQKDDTADPLPTNPKETDVKALLQLQMLPRVPFSPPLFFQQAFSLLGQQQLSPACLHPDVQQQQQLEGMAAQQQQHVSIDTLAAIHQALQQSGEVLQAAAAGAARRGAKAAAAALPQVLQALEEHGRHWTAAVTTEYCSWLEQQQQQQQHAVSSGSSTSAAAAVAAAAAPAAAGFHAAAAAAGGVDCLQPLVSDPDTWGCFLQELLNWPLGWQLHWSEAAVLLAGLRYFRDRSIEEARYELMRWRFKQERGGQQGTQTGHQQPGQQQQQQARKQTGKGSSKKQRQHKGGSSGKAGQAAAAAGGQEHAAEDGISSDEEKGDAGQDEFRQLAAALEKYRKCDLCELEREAGVLTSNSGSNCNNNSSSGSPKASTGLYDSFPVHWSDPYLMRRLLWDLLGRVKPTAQAWFRQHAFMCPHRGLLDEWRDVALSLARHLWGPPGEWDDSCEESVALLLPLRVREPTRLRDGAAAAEDAAIRGQYAQRLSAAYAQQGPDGQVAAVLSLQALLSLDPHGARVQPRPELLFYTPAGFHAAVAKTLMQALQPVPQNQRLHLQATAGQAHAGGSGLSNGTSAAAAAGSVTQQQEQPEQQQTEEEEEDQHSTEPHYLQAWTSAALPVWYVWWHVGLLAYQQQQQAVAAGGSSSRGASAKGSSGGRGSSSSNGTSAKGSSNGGSSSRGVHTPKEALKDLYASPDAR